MNVNKFLDAEEVIEHVNFVLRLIQNDMKKSKSGQLLNGYIEFHNKTCLLPGCSLKRVKFFTGTSSSSNNNAAGKRKVKKGENPSGNTIHGNGGASNKTAAVKNRHDKRH